MVLGSVVILGDFSADTVYQEVHSNCVFNKQIHIEINESCRKHHYEIVNETE